MPVLTLLTIGTLSALYVLVLTGTIALAARFCRVEVKRCNLFIGPRLWSGKAAGFPFTIRSIPVGGSVEFFHLQDEGEEKSKTAVPPVEFVADGSGHTGRRFSDLHPLARVAIALSGCTGLFLVSVLCLGPAGAWAAFLRGFVQVPAAAIAPLSTGKQLVGRLVEVASTMPFGVALGLIFTKEAALNLLPLPGLNGGEVLLTLMRWKRHGLFPGEGGVRCAGLLVLLALLGSLTLAALAYLYSLLV
jgi:membrane-associated protease RseP (regulator of RpoE activity)